MENKRVLVVGYTIMAEYSFLPFVREVTGVTDVETVHSMKELAKKDFTKSIDVIIINAMFIGIDIRKRLCAILVYCPEAQVICTSLITLSNFICGKLLKSGVDVLFCNLDSEKEFQKAYFAIQNKRKYLPTSLRESIANNEFHHTNGVSTLTRKERDTLVLTTRGYTLKEIAQKLSIQTASVSRRRRIIFEKTGVKNLAELIQIGMQYNLHRVESLESDL